MVMLETNCIQHCPHASLIVLRARARWILKSPIFATQFNNICLSVSGNWHRIHSGEGPTWAGCVRAEWPIRQHLRTTWSHRLPAWICDGFPTDGAISCSLFMFSSQSCCHLNLMSMAISGFRSERGIRHVPRSQFRAFLAARSACVIQPVQGNA